MSSPIRVCAISFDCYLLDPCVRRLAEAAADAGCMSDVICLREPGEERYEVCGSVHVYRIPMYRSFGASLPVMLLQWCCFLFLAAFTVTLLHLRKRYDVVHVHNMPDFLVFSALLPKLFGAKVVLHVQDACPELMSDKAKGRKRGLVVRLATWQERISTRFADHVTTIGWTVENLLVKRGVPHEKLTSILNSVDPRLFPVEYRSLPQRRQHEEITPFVLMYHGTIAERQGLDVAIRAVALAAPVIPGLQLLIKGRGESIPELKKLAEKLEVSERVVFMETSPYAEVVHFIAQGDVGIIPYRCGGYMEIVLPAKAYEFAWMHRPMICSDYSAMRSLFRPESVAFCEDENPESFASAIIDLYQHPEKRAALAANAAEDYKPYQWEKMAERYQKLLLLLGRGAIAVLSTNTQREQEKAAL